MKKAQKNGEGMGRILLRILSGAFALVLLLSLASFHPPDPHLWATGQVADRVQNLCGSLGANLAGLSRVVLGFGAWILPAYIIWECVPSKRAKWGRRIAWAALALSVICLLGAFGDYTWTGPLGQKVPLRWGGSLGTLLWSPLRRVLGPVGLPVILALMILTATFFLAPALSRATARLLAGFMGDRAWPWLRPLPFKGAQKALGWVKRPFLAWKGRAAARPAPELEASDFRDAEDLRAQDEAVAALERAERATAELRRSGAALPPELGLPVIQSVRLDPESAPRGPLPWESGALAPAAPAPDLASGELEGQVLSGQGTEELRLSMELPPPTLLRNLPPPPPPRKPLVTPLRVEDRYGRVAEQAPLGLTEPTPARPLAAFPEPPPARRPSQTLGDAPAQADRTPRPHASPSADLGSPHRAPAPPPPAPAPPGAFAPADRMELPPRRLFDPPKPGERLDPKVLEDTRTLIGQKLLEFKVKGQVAGCQPGPVVTVYEFQPDPGVPLAKVMGMEEDLAMGLQAEKVRIDRIPGRNLVGIEVPNPRREVICFREVVDSPVFRDPSHKDARSLLTMALGKDMGGHPVVADLAKMPHLLIGGSTGSGKSVGVNAMICSILLRALPDEVKLILVDPKMVELGIYEGIPHLWAPVVTDMKEAGRVLKWVVTQMEDRYRRLALLSVRNLEGFNAKIQECGGSIDLSDRTPNPRWPDRPPFMEALPYVVVVIDELADLMMVARTEVEESIARIAQKARAVGIHLVLATQRPSVDIVTGVIKANLPSRLSYRVNTKIDSRTILDSGGGEQLLGKGDALFLAPGTARPRRIHAPLISEEEILRLVEWLKERGRPDFNEALLRALSAEEEAGGAEGAGDLGGGSGDDIYDRAVAVVRRERKASTSLLQRKLNIGYGRAARLIDRMEEEGIVGPDRGAGKPREVLDGLEGGEE